MMTKGKVLPAGLRWRGDTIWIDISWEGERIRESTKTSDVKLALARLNKLRVELHEGTYAHARAAGIRGEYTVTTAFDRALEGEWMMEGSDLSPKAARSHMNMLVKSGWIEPSTPVTALDRQALTRIQRGLMAETCKRSGKPFAANTINGRMWVLRSILAQAERDGAIKEVPKFPKRLDTSEAVRERTLTEQEEMAILTYLGSDDKYADLRDLWVILLDTGLRHFEGVRLTRAQFDKEGMINLPGSWSKNRKPRSLPASQRVLEIVARRTSAKQPALFPVPDGMAPRYWFAKFGEQWREVRAAMGLETEEGEQIVMHTARHTMGTRLFAVGQADLRSVMAWLGHKKPEMSLRYSKAVGAKLREVSETMQRAKFSAPSSACDSDSDGV